MNESESMPRECPHGWTNCNDCFYKQLCHLGLYEPELEIQKEQHQAVIEAAAVAEETVHEEALKSAKKIKRVPLVDAEPEVFWPWWARTSPPDPENKQREVIMGGAVELKGGSKSGKRRKKPKRRADFSYLYLNY